MLRPVVSLSVIARVHSHVVRRSRSFATTAAAAASTLQLHHQHGVPYHHCQPATRYTSLVRVGDTHSTSPLVLRRSISEVIEAVPGVGSLLWAASYFSDVRAVAALAAIGTLGYRWHMDRKRERLVSRETFVSEVMEHIERQYTPPPLLLDLPLLRRPKVSQLRGLIERRMYPCFLVMLEGSSRCGKTALVQQLCAGRRRVIYIPFREQQVTPRTIANAFGYRTFGSEDIELEEILSVTKTALLNIFAVRTASDAPPLVILDDLHSEVDHSTYTLSKTASRLFDFLCEMKNEQLLNVLAISSEARTMREIIQNKAKYTAWYDTVSLGDVDAAELEQALRERYSGPDAKYLVENLGSHIGHIEDVLRSCSYHHFGGKVVKVVDSIIQEECDRMTETILGQQQRPSNIDMATWATVTCGLFETLLESESNTVNLVELARTTKTPILSVLAVVRHLVVQNQIYLMGPDRVCWHVPAQKRAARAALDSALVRQLRCDLAEAPKRERTCEERAESSTVDEPEGSGGGADADSPESMPPLSGGAFATAPPDTLAHHHHQS